MDSKNQKSLQRFIELRKEGHSLKEIAKILGVSLRTAERRSKESRKLLTEEDIEIIQENVKLAKQKQKYQDINRIERKSFRDNVRWDNALEELNKELIDAVKKIKIKQPPKKSTKINNKKVVGVLHITDTHFNEMIDLDFNKYDFNIASKRLKKFVDSAKRYLDAHNVTDLVVCFTGDLINSDRRPDEYLTQSSNRANALVLAVKILTDVLIDLMAKYRVSVASVIGNESRIPQEVGWTELVATDNYDATIHNMLKLLVENKGVKFIGKVAVENVINVSGQNILLLHGNQLKSSNFQKQIQQIIGKYSSQGVKIDFILSGHWHNTRIGDIYAQASSPAGANAYSNQALQLYSRASQNLHIMFDDGSRDSIKIDLQEVEGVEGYPIVKELEEYNCKSLNKAKKKVMVYKVV